MTTEKGSVPIFPGLEDPECAAAASKAHARMHEIDANSTALLRAMMASAPAAKDLAFLFDDDLEVAVTWCTEVLENQLDRRDAYETFTNALAGRLQ